MPIAAKDEIRQRKSPQFRGYSRLGGELTMGKVGCVSRSTSGLNDKSSTGAAGCWRLQGTNLRPRRRDCVRRLRIGARPPIGGRAATAAA